MPSSESIHTLPLSSACWPRPVRSSTRGLVPRTDTRCRGRRCGSRTPCCSCRAIGVRAETAASCCQGTRRSADRAGRGRWRIRFDQRRNSCAVRRHVSRAMIYHGVDAFLLPVLCPCALDGGAARVGVGVHVRLRRNCRQRGDPVPLRSNWYRPRCGVTRQLTLVTDHGRGEGFSCYGQRGTHRCVWVPRRPCRAPQRPAHASWRHSSVGTACRRQAPGSGRCLANSAAQPPRLGLKHRPGPQQGPGVWGGGRDRGTGRDARHEVSIEKMPRPRGSTPE